MGQELGGPTRSTSQRLDEKRYVAAGERAYVMGAADGSFPPLGTQIKGEMGGVWAHPIKLLTGYWFAVDGEWLPPAQRFISGAGYIQMILSPFAGLAITRLEFSPDDLPVVLVALTLRNTTADQRRCVLTMQARSQLVASYPWTSTEPAAETLNAHDEASYQPDGRMLVFTRPDKPWRAIVAATPQPNRGAAGDQYWGPVAEEQRAGYSQRSFSSGGELRWDLELSDGAEQTIWIAIAGSNSATSDASEAITAALRRPAELLGDKIAEREALLARARLSLPEPELIAAFEWGKLNMGDLRRTVAALAVRDVCEGKAYPPPIATLSNQSGLGDGYPDYPWFFGTGSGYIVFPLVVAGMWEAAMDHLRLLRDVSRAVNGRTGKVVHEVASDGSVYFGNNAAKGDINEIGLFAEAVDLLWRWTGDDAFRDEMYDFMVDGVRYVTTELDADGDLWPEGLGIGERPGMGSEQLDAAVDTWSGLQALERMAASKGDSATAAWARAKVDLMEAAFDADWWMPGESLYADSRCNGDDCKPEKEKEREQKGWKNVCQAADQRLQQRIWINVKPMETTIAPPERAHPALDCLESPEFSGQGGLFLVGEGGGPDGQAVRKAWTVMSGVMAVAEANYGRLGEHQALRYMRAIAATLDLEMPGALPELAASPDYDPLGDFSERMMVMQAWASYGIAWPIISNLLGILPHMPDKTLTVTPQVPPTWPGLAVHDLRLGSGSISVSAAREDHHYTTRVEAIPGLKLLIGHTIPFEQSVASVELDDIPASYTTTKTRRGQEVHVKTTSDTAHTLTIRVR
jgi:glycogen debranching enzyme